MSELKHALREGLKVIEELEDETINQGSQRLVDAARAAPKLLEGFYARVYAGRQEIKLKAAKFNTHSVASRMKSSEVFRIKRMVDPDPGGVQRTPLLTC